MDRAKAILLGPIKTQHPAANKTINRPHLPPPNPLMPNHNKQLHPPQQQAPKHLQFLPDPKICPNALGHPMSLISKLVIPPLLTRETFAAELLG